MDGALSNSKGVSFNGAHDETHQLDYYMYDFLYDE